MTSPSVAYALTASMSAGIRLISGSAASVSYPCECGVDSGLIAGLAHLLEPLELPGLVLVGDLQERDLFLLAAFGERVDTDDEPTAGVEPAFEVVCGVGDAALEPVVLDPFDHAFEHRTAADLVEVGEQFLGLRVRPRR